MQLIAAPVLLVPFAALLGPNAALLRQTGHLLRQSLFALALDAGAALGSFRALGTALVFFARRLGFGKLFTRFNGGGVARDVPDEALLLRGFDQRRVQMLW